MKIHKAKSITFSIQIFRYIILIFVVVLILLNGWIVYHSLYDNNLHQSTIIKDAFKTNSSNSFVNNKATDVLKLDFIKDLDVYLKALNHSVKIINLPFPLSQNVINQCQDIKTKGSLIDHQHSMEIHFPRVLTAMSSTESSQSELRPLYIDNNDKNKRKNNELKNDNELSSLPPLFYYIEAYPYHAIYCTYKKNDKEDWTKRDPYWLSTAEYLLSSIPEFMTNVGMDFIAPASHPLSGPYAIHPYTMSYLHRITFLRTDFDVSGSDPKDIIVPYFSAESCISKSAATTTTTTTKTTETDTKTEAITNDPPIVRTNRNLVLQSPKEIFLYFSGADFPEGGYRYLFGTKLDEYMNSIRFQSSSNSKHLKIIYSTTLISNQEYLEKMSSSLFCLCIRGDTKSMRRIYTAIANGCIPIVISDWIEFPFDSLIDYSQFIIQFPENIIYNMPFLIDYLNNLAIQNNGEFIKHIQTNLLQASGLLLYPVVTIEHSTFLKEKSQYNNNRLRSYYDPSSDPNDNSNTNNLNSRESGSNSNNGILSPLKFPLLNPVTLILIEALIRRKQYCKHFTATLINHNGTTSAYATSVNSHRNAMSMCQNLMKRLELAESSIRNNN